MVAYVTQKLPILRKPLSILGHFLCRQALVGVVAIVLAVLAVQQLFRLQTDHAFDQRVLELAAMIDSAAAISRAPEHLRFTVRELGRNSRVKEIVILSARDGSQLAATRPRNVERDADGSTLAERLGRRALASGRFALKIESHGGDHFSVLPLSLAAFLLSGDNILAPSHWSVPRWYGQLQAQSQLDETHGPFASAYSLFQHDHGEAFTLPVGSYSGVVVINSGDNWIVGLIRSDNAYVAAVLVLVVAGTMLSAGLFFRSAVQRPLQAFATTIERMRASDRVVRKPMHGIREFDAVAAQWNALVDKQASTKEALTRSQDQYQRLIDNLPGYVYMCDNDQDWTMRYVSASFKRLVGLAVDDIIGNQVTSMGNLIHPDDRERVWISEQESLAAHRPCELQYRIITPSGTEKWVLDCSRGVYDADGNVIRLEGYIDDITALKQHERDLDAARQKAEAANRAKSAFIANTNHEMRTPLNAIVGFSEMLAAERLGPLGNPEYREFARLIESSGRSLLAIISTIMELSRLQSGDAGLDVEEIAPGETVARIVRLWTTRAKARGIAIALRNSARGVRLAADEHYLGKIVDNLLSNAVKFSTEGGKVRVSLRLDARRRVVLAVADEGIGIAREHLGDVTQPFFQVDKSLGRDTGGIGLGLTMVRECASLHRASLDIKSKPGKGTRVTVTFPAAATVPDSVCRPRPLPHRPRHRADAGRAFQA